LKKLPVFQQLLANYNLAASEVAYVGDDLPDLPLLIRAGLPIAVANACPEVKARAMYITTSSGGKGAIREVAELILKAQGKWDRIVEGYLE
jgi:3-deoxy-D-manno-octulosonate 8-phosphate phosphatase (KDO 8-P phosphatase)